MDSLDRLYGRLVEALRREHPDSLDRPVTISEIYQSLVPYRAVRSELGFSELAEYEHTLLRLLAGENGYVAVEMPQVRDDFRRELRSPNPILGLYRDYAAVEARVRTTAGAAPAGADREDEQPLEPPRRTPPPRVETAPAAEPEEADTAPHAFPTRPAASEASPPSARRAPPPPRTTGTRTTSRPRTSRTCRACAELLPDIGGWEVRYCPFCGESQKPTPCRECGTSLEPEWKFCIQCGTPRRVSP